MSADGNEKTGKSRSRIRDGKDGRQIVTIARHRWTDEAEAKFLDGLATTCNVKFAARAAGFSTEGIYRRRMRDPSFAERWEAAKAQGYARIEIALVRAAAETMEGHAPDPDLPFPPMTVQDAVTILKLHRPDEGRAPGRHFRPRSLDEVRDSILTKLEAIEALRLAELAELGAPLPTGLAELGAPLPTELRAPPPAPSATPDPSAPDSPDAA